MKEISSNNGIIIFGDEIARDILNLPAGEKIEDIPDSFLVDKNKLGKTYKGNLRIDMDYGRSRISSNGTIYFHICYPQHVQMTENQYTSWTERFPNSSQDERIIFVPNGQEGQ